MEPMGTHYKALSACRNQIRMHYNLNPSADPALKHLAGELQFING